MVKTPYTQPSSRVLYRMSPYHIYIEYIYIYDIASLTKSFGHDSYTAHVDFGSRRVWPDGTCAWICVVQF